MIPIRTDYRMRSTPWVNYALVAINVIVFLLGINGMTAQARGQINNLLLHPDNPQMHQFFTSMFLHGGWMHLIGNMVFLWVFGNGINDRFGQIGYPAFYLAGGLLAAGGYVLFSPHAPVLGASGAISAVTGAYLVLLPKTRVTVLMILFYFWTPMEISSLFFLVIQLAFNLWMAGTTTVTGSSGGVAYVAHASGYVYGIGIASALLALKLLPRDPFDLLNLISAYRRRSQYRRMAQQGYDPFNHANASLRTGGKHVRTKATAEPPADSPLGRERALRKEIAASISRGDLPTAASQYLQLVQIADDAVLSSSQQLDVANQLMASNQHAAAADAYERFLTHFGRHEHRADIHLILGLIYGRYLHADEKAGSHLRRAIKGLTDDSKIALARADLQAIDARRRR